jgi:ferritin
MTSAAFVEKLNEQIGHELGAHQQYVAIAVHYDALTMPQMAALFYAQALEERDHAMMMVQYLLDAGETPRIPALPAPVVDSPDVVAPVQAALDQERAVSDQVHELTRVARADGDFASEQFMQWFIREQVEEVAKMGDLLAVVTRAKDDVDRIEDWVAREEAGESTDPTAPRIAGA